MRKLLGSITVLVVLLAACGREKPVERAAVVEPPKFPLTLTTGAGTVTLPAPPKRIVSLSPTATEMLFAIEAGSQVVAVDDQSTYPTNAPKTKLSGFQPNVEAVAGYKPDLVVFASDTKKLAPAFKALAVPALEEPAAKTLDDTYAQITQLGQATGHAAEAKKVVDSMRSQVQRVVGSAPKRSDSPTYYHELDNMYFTATSKTFIGQLYGLLGLSNIADPADKAATGYPQLSAEFIIRANPDYIFLADTKCCKQTQETVAARAGWKDIAAVKDHKVVALDDDIVSRWGPRIVDFLRAVADALE
jgi:iron complex transport system substrate-binding protein